MYISASYFGFNVVLSNCKIAFLAWLLMVIMFNFSHVLGRHFKITASLRFVRVALRSNCQGPSLGPTAQFL